MEREKTEYEVADPVEDTLASKVTGSMRNDRGVATLEIILIIVVLVALVVIFRDQIVSLVTTVWKSINGDANDLL